MSRVLLKKSSVAGKVPVTSLSDPANGLEYGELALNYADGKLYFKNSSNVITSFSSGNDLSAILDRRLYTVTTAGSNTLSVNYVVGFIDVFVNGVKLNNTEFTATSGAAVVIPDLSVNDEVQLVGYLKFSLAGLTINGSGLAFDVNSGVLTINSATTATANTLALRDGSGNLTATNLSGTNTGDNVVNSLYSGLVTNATHTGDATGSTTLTLATVNTNVGAFGSATNIPVVTVNAKGLVTAVSTVAVSIPSGAITIVGDVTGSGTTGSSTTLTLATVNSNIGTWNNVTVNAKGLVTGGSNTAYLTAVTPSNFSSQTANTVLAAPNGSAGAPTFRAIVGADIPTLNQNTTGSAATLTTGRTIALTGDVTYTSGSFNGSANATGTATLASVGTAGTYTKVTTDAKGRVTSGTTLSASDIPSLDASKITSGTIDAARLPSYVDDVIEGTNLAAFPATGETGKIYIALDTNKTYRWSGSAYVYITSGAVDSVGGYTGVVTSANLLASLLTVDGTGSGLDADLLDGNSAAAFYLASNPSGYTTNTGTVTGVTATAPVASSGGTAPVISMAAASSGVNGYMTGAYATKLDGIASGATANTGTVTSVATSGTVSGLTLTGGTITTTGTITLGGTLAVLPSNFASQTANTFLAAPNGAAGTPTFRTLVAADVPTLNQNTTGSAAYATSSSRLYSTDASYAYGSAAPYYGYLSYVSANSRWRFAVTPATPAGVEVAYADTAGSAGSAGTVTSRTLTIGNTGKAVDHSANVSWTLAEIGAYAATNPNGYTTNTGTVTGVTATTPIVSSGGTAPVITHATSGATAGTYNNVTVNTFGHVTAGSNAGYLTAESDTLATVTGRGATTSTSVTLSGTGNQFGGHFYFLPYDAAGNHYPHFNDGGSASGTKINWRLYTGVNNTVTHTWTTSLATFATNIAASNFSGSSSGTNTGDNAGVTAVAGVTPIISSGGTTPSISHATSGVGAGTYNNVTVNTFGHVTSGSNTAYLTGYTETDTLATVTSRGNTATASIGLPAGEANGYCFWGNGTSYKISMGETAGLFKYGPVTDYSIKMQMDSGSTGRGFTWGRDGAKPIAALNSTSGNMQIAGTFSAASKSFLIPHPTKPGMQLRYGSLEGPENGVYIRGKLKGNNKIELPEYWTKLVDPDSISVTLTPIGKHQKLYVEDIADNVVTVGNDGLFAGEINCFFVVYGERVDIDKLVVEYE